jgi:putative transposase
MDKVVALMTVNEDMNGQAFAGFIEHFLCPKLWQGAVVVMDNLPAHKVASIVPIIESVGASVISLSPYSPDFNPIELWCSQLKAFLRRFAPTTSSTIDRILAVALHLIEPEHLKKWFTNCCYCTS